MDDADGEKACSCYTFENRERAPGLSWPNAREWCESKHKLLVVMETIEEWEFINGSLKDQIGSVINEWHIGLLKNQTTGNWSWINGRPLTFDKWQPNKPRKDDLYVLFAKEYPTDKCQGICMHHYPESTSTTRPPATNTLRSSSTTSNTENQLTEAVSFVLSHVKPFRVASFSKLFSNRLRLESTPVSHTRLRYV
ncbi:hypothetical protein P5673_027851 [Acropora cervicornis]|uniref:C-type lectin domain-containing protein n=1 Tax=Acropora cervicornis TaxID=6130 RepID=A0AAD9PY67_ACRCE|nr:hypothetical protein P5673_027851 [Acropora cervicornis]